MVRQLTVSQGGVPKLPVPRAVLHPLGLAGDAVANKRVHGGPERAVCLYALERIEGLQAEGHDIFPGALGSIPRPEKRRRKLTMKLSYCWTM